jgi:hypothetical protein
MPFRQISTADVELSNKALVHAPVAQKPVGINGEWSI